MRGVATYLVVIAGSCVADTTCKGEPGLALLQLQASWQASPALDETTRPAPRISEKQPQAPKVVYGIFTSERPEYRKKLEAVMETWGQAPLSEGRFVAVGGRTYPTKWQNGSSVIAVDCADAQDGLSCKEANLLAEGAKRGADWLFISGEDNYVDTAALEEHLEKTSQRYNPGGVVALGQMGCGSGNTNFCESVRTKSGLCGGGGYAISRGALAALMANGREALIREYGGRERQLMPNDMSTSCALYDRGAEFPYFGGLFGGPTFGMKDYEQMITSTSVFHYVTPEVMHWVHGLKTGLPASQMKALEGYAFDRGCARGMDNEFWHSQYTTCLEEHHDSRHLLAYQHLAIRS
jgi:hypothetical protein